MAEEAIYSFVLDSIRDLVIHEAQFLYGVGDQVRELERQLNRMRWFLRDTANQDGQKRVLDWVLQVRDLAYEAENVIETYAIKASRPRGGIGGTIKRFAGVLKECYHPPQIGSDIETLMSKISVLTDLDKYGIRQIMENRDDGASRRPLLRRAYSTVNDEDDLFVGSHDSINMLAEKLVTDQHRTVSLYGMGGLGKTTLARKVYRHPVVMKHFDAFAWVWISQQWQKEDILREILIKLMPDHKSDDIQKWRDEKLVGELSQFLSTRKCLLVFDDIWSIDAWDSIKSAISISKKGSKVLLTTRNVEVTLLDTSGYTYELQFLTVDESWELLRNKALRDQDSVEITKKEKIGKEMIAQCGGLPLAVVALGGILSYKGSYDEWETVRDNIEVYLRNATRGENNVERVLALSYDDLPFQLKPCFLYLSKYAEDAEIEVETLYQYWMAEGMVSSEDKMRHDETIMDVAEHYLNELANRCMVFVQKEEERPFEHSFSKLKSCRLHNLMRDFCIFKAKEENFLKLTDYRNINDVVEASSISVCRLSISLAEENDVKRFVPPTKALRRSLRSFTLDLQAGYTGELPNTSKFSEFVMLRVLSVKGVETKDNEDDSTSATRGVCSVVYHKKIDPLSIGNLVHLRYLSLRENGFFILAKSINKLKQLQTLDLRDQRVVWIPNVIWKLPRLNHLYLPNIKPSDLAKKLGLNELPQLEILEGFNNKVCNVNHLSTLTNLRKLEATVEDELEDLEELINHVSKLTHLRFLGLTIISGLSSEKAVAIMNDVLSCSNLVSLYIQGQLSKFPEYDSGFCRNLRSLRLTGCSIEEDPLSTLERLNNLRTLWLEPDSFVGKEMSCHASGFPQLRFLRLHGLVNLEKWEIEDGAMTNLSELVIQGCSKLEMIPAGLRCNTLKELNIISMPEEFKKRVRVNEDGEEGPDFHKLRHVQTINIS